MPNMNDILRQANIMQNKVSKLQQEMGAKTVEASAGGGAVKVVATCRQEVKSVTIDPAALKEMDAEMLQDLVLTAVNEALRIGKATLEREMAAITGGLHLPGIL